jgi:hypothetical protein
MLKTKLQSFFSNPMDTTMLQKVGGWGANFDSMAEDESLRSPSSLQEVQDIQAAPRWIILYSLHTCSKPIKLTSDGLFIYVVEVKVLSGLSHLHKISSTLCCEFLLFLMSCTYFWLYHMVLWSFLVHDSNICFWLPLCIWKGGSYLEVSINNLNPFWLMAQANSEGTRQLHSWIQCFMVVSFFEGK